MDNHRHLRFLPPKAHRPAFPVHVLAFEVRDVALTAAQMPAQLVKRLPLRVHLGGDDALMFFRRDASFLLEFHFRPLAFGHQWPRQPVHVYAEIVQPAQKDIRGHRAGLHDFQEQFAGRLDDDTGEQGSQRLVSGHGAPTVLVGSLLRVGEAFESLLPCPGGDAVVGAGQIRLGDLQVRNRTGTGSFSKTHCSAITTTPPEANSLITNEYQ